MLAEGVHGLEPVLAQCWWVLWVRGALAIVFGLTTLAWPDLSFAVLLMFVASWFLADGAVSLFQAFTSEQRWPHVLDAALSIAGGVLVIFYPGMAGLLLTVTIAIWLIAKGVAQVLIALRFGGTHPGAWLLGVLGITTAGVGAFLVHNPADALGSMSLISGFAVVLGMSFVALGWWFER